MYDVTRTFTSLSFHKINVTNLCLNNHIETGNVPDDTYTTDDTIGVYIVDYDTIYNVDSITVFNGYIRN